MAFRKVKFDLRNPKDARKYVKMFSDEELASITIETNSGKMIDFKKMTDDEACVAAHLLFEHVADVSRKSVKH